MRNSFIKHVTQAAYEDSSIYLITGDMGFSVLEIFQNAFPNRYINAGIAEQNMISMAAGLAMAGKNVFVYSTVPFVTMRCFEQIRINICYQKLPIKLIGVGGGFSHGPMGVTHHSTEDVSIMRVLPGMTIVAPGSKHELDLLAHDIIAYPEPIYLRITKTQETVVYPENNTVQLGKALEIIPSDTYLLATTSSALDLGYNICHELRSIGIDIGLVSLHTIKPIDINYFLEKQKTLKGIFTLEEHLLIGGIGEALSYIICTQFNKKIIFKSFGINDIYPHKIGTRAYLLENFGLTQENISTAIKQNLQECT